MMSNELILISLLITKHFVTDFVLQNEYQFKNKGIYGHPGGILHAVITGIGTMIVLGVAVLLSFNIPASSFLTAVAVEVIAHYHTDWAKTQIKQRWALRYDNPHFWNLLGFDQWLHYLVYVWMVWYIIV